MARRLTLVAGSGYLVPYLASAARGQGFTVQIIDLIGGGNLEAERVLTIPLAEAGALVTAVKSFRTSHLLLAGAVRISDADREGLASAFGLAGRMARSLGDIGLAGMILLYCRLNRVRLLGAQDIAPDLLAGHGTLAGQAVTGSEVELCRHALRLAREVGRLDLGQSLVVSGRRPVAAEDAEGTDALIGRVGRLREQGLVGNGRGPLILAKAVKPKQPRFADLPAIGPETVINAADAGIRLVAVEAGRTLILDRVRLIAEAEAREVSVVGIGNRDG